MSLKTQRKLAARILGVGVNRVWINPEKIEDVETAVTGKDIKRLIKDGIITLRPIKGVSRGRARARHLRRRMGRRRGLGSRKGGKFAKLPRKKRWIQTIRALRRTLKELRDKRLITSQAYRKLYIMAKGGV
ncbi:MAG: 50S ribosomal protein L19e, partial [Candidatus Bathyarchaeota archaeon]|nr:50S ribosomal protein L19e [Candidatus Bathyarchaeota archaeon]